MWARCVAVLVVVTELLGAACAVPPGSAPPAGRPAPAAASAPLVASGPADAAPPALPVVPAVDLKVGVLPMVSYGPFFIAHDRGYFQEVGLNVELVGTGNVLQQLPAIAQGQLHAGSCATNVGCFNALNRRTDIQIVADLESAGRTERSTGNLALVVRKDLWDRGAIRGAHDLVGRTVYVQAGAGSGGYVVAARWLRRLGIPPHSIDWSPMLYPDVYAALQNGGIEVGFTTEPLVSAGVARSVHHILATQEEMHPTAARLFVTYWAGIDQLGPLVGERFMVAYLRGVRDYINAFEYGVDLDAIVDILMRETPLKDRELCRQIKYAWVDPNGQANREAIQADVELLAELGHFQTPVDLSAAFEDKYRAFAVRYLGPYQPPR
jgi:NitT/TauT family transport system substrate-binding protein